ncbi:hypothetical protein BLX87_01675 [Bacillus sp. VT-16-64]|nr:hypothetical protein BLX87_01675 [Bacillus sp. VT-16-64]
MIATTVIIFGDVKTRSTGRKHVYIAIIRQTGHTDLAAYASDDVDLVIGFLAAGKGDDFTHFLQTAYENGKLPSDEELI